MKVKIHVFIYIVKCGLLHRKYILYVHKEIISISLSEFLFACNSQPGLKISNEHMVNTPGVGVNMLQLNDYT